MRHVLVTRAVAINQVRNATGKNTVWHKAMAAFALGQRRGTKLSATGRFMEVGWPKHLYHVPVEKIENLNR
jgi:hypothetical protein